MISVITEHIESTEGVCGGRPRIAGHRIRVVDVAVLHGQGLSSEEILGHYPSLTLADVHAALAYYFDHRDELDRDLEADRRLAEEMRAQQRGPLAAKLDRLRRERDTIPPG